MRVNVLHLLALPILAVGCASTPPAGSVEGVADSCCGGVACGQAADKEATIAVVKAAANVECPPCPECPATPDCPPCERCP